MALAPYARPVTYCEIEKYCQSVLLQRMQEGLLPVAPIWGNVQTLPLEQLPQVDLITAGFPCQDISVAGLGKGLEGERSGLFFEIAKIARELLPSFIFLENVPAVTLRGGPTVVGTLADMGYDCRWCVVSAEQFGALHQRKRWFCLAYSKHNGELASKRGKGIRESLKERRKQFYPESIGQTKRASLLSSDVADTKIQGFQRQQGKSQRVKKEKSLSTMCSQNDCYAKGKSGEQTNIQAVSVSTEKEAWRVNSGECWPFKSRDDWQEIVGRVGRGIDGVSPELDFNKNRLHALGNSVVPIQARKAFEILIGKYKGD